MPVTYNAIIPVSAFIGHRCFSGVVKLTRDTCRFEMSPISERMELAGDIYLNTRCPIQNVPCRPTFQGHAPESHNPTERVTTANRQRDGLAKARLLSRATYNPTWRSQCHAEIILAAGVSHVWFLNGRTNFPSTTDSRVPLNLQEPPLDCFPGRPQLAHLTTVLCLHLPSLGWILLNTECSCIFVLVYWKPNPHGTFDFSSCKL